MLSRLADDDCPIPVSASDAVASRQDPANIFGALSNSGSMTKIVAKLAAENAFVGSGKALPRQSLPDSLDMGAVADLERMGVVRTSADDVGGLHLAVEPRHVEWRNLKGVQSPVRVLQVSTSLEPLHKSKVELIVSLRRQGWAHSDPPLEPHAVDSARVFVMELTKPTSYFAAMACADDLFKKGVIKIRHNGPDSYYRCLFVLHGARLGNFLRSVDENARGLHNFCVGVLKEAGEAIEDTETAVTALPLQDIGTGGIDGEDQQLIALEAAPGWSRCVVHVGADSHRLRIYFDNFSSRSSASQLGLIECHHHGCRKHINVLKTRAEFCAWAYCWETAGVHEPREKHLDFEPDPQAVETVLADLVLEDF